MISKEDEKQNGPIDCNKIDLEGFGRKHRKLNAVFNLDRGTNQPVWKARGGLTRKLFFGYIATFKRSTKLMVRSLFVE